MGRPHPVKFSKKKKRERREEKKKGRKREKRGRRGERSKAGDKERGEGDIEILTHESAKNEIKR